MSPATTTLTGHLEGVDGQNVLISSVHSKVLRANSSSLVGQDDGSGAAVLEAATLLKSGMIVAIPTETVYGLAASALNPQAVQRIFKAKGRPSDNPLIVHVSDMAMFEKLLPHTAAPFIERYRPVIDRYWPGPLTILIPKPDYIPAEVTAGQALLAVRMPSHPLARRVISACGFPLAAPSANSSGRPSPTLASHVVDDLGGDASILPLILDGGPCESGVESTVLDAMCDPPCILRPGGVTFEQLQALPGMIQLRVYKRDFVDAKLEAAPTTPGMKYRHYTPDAHVYLVEWPQEHSAAKLHQHNILQREIYALRQTGDCKIGTLRSGHASHPYDDVEYDLFLGAEASDVAHALFRGMRELEAKGASHIFVEGVSDSHEGLAVMNRIRKAASKTFSA